MRKTVSCLRRPKLKNWKTSIFTKEVVDEELYERRSVQKWRRDSPDLYFYRKKIKKPVSFTSRTRSRNFGAASRRWNEVLRLRRFSVTYLGLYRGALRLSTFYDFNLISLAYLTASSSLTTTYFYIAYIFLCSYLLIFKIARACGKGCNGTCYNAAHLINFVKASSRTPGFAAAHSGYWNFFPYGGRRALNLITTRRNTNGSLIGN